MFVMELRRNATFEDFLLGQREEMGERESKNDS
jgi:hypothetical protein